MDSARCESSADLGAKAVIRKHPHKSIFGGAVVYTHWLVPSSILYEQQRIYCPDYCSIMNVIC